MRSPEEIAGRTADAYMASSYGAAAWREVARFLSREGFEERAIEAILRSKHMRWADDGFGRGAQMQTNSAAFRRYYAANPREFTDSAVAELVAQTPFGGGR